jgi:CheY-like chemotaxis protein
VVKDEKLAPVLQAYANSPGNPHYLAYFDLFNRGLFFEAHEVLEEIWLPERGKAKALFYKGLIQLAGAFVHLAKNRPGPASALLRLARANLQGFSPSHEDLDVSEILVYIDNALRRLKSEPFVPGRIVAPRFYMISPPPPARGPCAKPFVEQLSFKRYISTTRGGHIHMLDQVSVLLAEDDENDIFLMRRAFERVGVPNPLFVVQNGQEAINYLSGTGQYQDRNKFPMPGLLLLDLKMPWMDGFDVLKWLRAHREFDTLPVVVLTSSKLQGDIDKSREYGVYDYRVKPQSFDDLMRLLDDVRKCWLDERFNRFCSPQPALTAAKKAG